MALSGAAQKRSPYAYLGGELVGGAAIPGLGAEALATKLGGGAAARFAGYGAVGAGQGAAAGAGNTYSGNLSDYATNALLGGTLGGVLGGTMGSVLGPRPIVSAAKTPTTAEIYAARDFGYDALRANQGQYENPYLAARGDRVAADTAHYTPGDIPSTNRAIEQMRATADVPGGLTSPSQIEDIRKGINTIPFTPERAADRQAGRLVKNAIDQFYAFPPLGAVRAGTEAEASTAGEIADMSRRLHGGGRRAQTFDNILHDAELASNNPRSGVSYPDAVWSGVRNLEKSDRPGAMPKLTGYSDAEKAALERIAYPGFGQRALSGAANWLGGSGHGIVNPITLAAGGAGTGAAAYSYLGLDPKTGAMLGAAAPLTGLAARIGSNRMANNAIRDAYDVIHQSNPLYDARVMSSGTKSGGGLPSAVNDPVRNAIANTLTNRLYIGRNDPSQEGQ